MANNFTAVNNLTGFMNIANENTGGYFWMGILFMFMSIIFMSLIGFGVEIALLAASFVGLLAGILLVYMGLVSISWLLMIVGILIGTLLWIIYGKREYS